MTDPIVPTSDATPGWPARLRLQVAQVRRELSNLVVPDEHHVKLHFLRLAMDTCGSMRVSGGGFPFDMDVTSPRCPACWRDGRRDDLPARVRAGWDGWPSIWADLMHRHPRLNLAEAIAVVGTVLDRRTWPHGREERLRDWVDADGAGDLAPGDDPVETANIRKFLLPELRSLRAGTGGWVWWDAERGRRVFRADDQGIGR